MTKCRRIARKKGRILGSSQIITDYPQMSYVCSDIILTFVLTY